jgi:hypothetical protein
VNVCRRCVVPTRNSRTGAITGQFRDVFEAWRAKTLPAEVDASAWGQIYRLALNLRIATTGEVSVAVGQAVGTA